MPSSDHPDSRLDANEDRSASIESVKNAVTGREFDDWRRREEYRENIRDGNPEYNGGGYPVEACRHSPHNLMQCPRKIWYREHNAPREVQQVDGIFELGSYVEEEIIEPWLDDLARDLGYYISNSLWVEGEVDTGSGTVHIKGSTDPVFCDEDSIPKLLTEVKSKQSLSKFSGASRHHKAQATAYQYAIAETHEIDPPDALIIYAGRKHLDVEVIELEFDPDFFVEIQEWMSGLTECRIEDELPPRAPEMGWECDLCSFQERCGEGDEPWEDLPAEGFVPRVKYNRGEVLDHLAAHPSVKITPTIASQHPTLTGEYDVHAWLCPACGQRYAWDEFGNWDGDPEEPPWCPSCASDRDACVFLRGELPAEDV